jgi:hypothetical protein
MAAAAPTSQDDPQRETPDERAERLERERDEAVARERRAFDALVEGRRAPRADVQSDDEREPADPGPEPDPLIDPDKHRAWRDARERRVIWIAGAPARRMEQRERERERQQALWQRYRERYPDLSEDADLVRSQFLAVTEGTGIMRDGEEDAVLDRVASRVRKYTSGRAAGDDGDPSLGRPGSAPRAPSVRGGTRRIAGPKPEPEPEKPGTLLGELGEIRENIAVPGYGKFY